MKLRTMRIIVMCLTAAVLGAAISGCSTLSVSGSGNLEVMHPSIDGFTELAVDDAFEVTVVPGAVYNVTVTVDDNVVQYVIIEETGDRLRLGLDPDRDYRDVTLEASITMPRLAGIALSGASSLSVSSSGTLPYEASLPVTLSGASTLRLPATSVGQATFNLSGASSVDAGLSAVGASFVLSGASVVEIDGTCGDIEAEGDGASTLDLGDLSAKNVDMRLDGASTAWVTMDGVLDADLDGASRLFYRAVPQGTVTLGAVSISGGSQLQPF